MSIDIEKVRALAEIMRDCGLSELNISDDDGSVILKRESERAEVFNSEFAKNNGGNIDETDLRTADALDSKHTDELSMVGESWSDVAEIKSPLVGMFYISPSPDEKPYAPVGMRVKKGDILCVIEAMKIMNEIRAENDCEIVDICAENGSIVEYGQTLFKVI